MAKILFVILSLISLALSHRTGIEMENFGKFQDFMFKFKKHYKTPEEFMKRYEIFKTNLPNFPSGPNKFADLTPEEFQAFLQGKTLDSPPDSFNWVDEGAFGPVVNQAACGSFVFSALGNLEALYFIKYKTKITLSLQQLIDCNEDFDVCRGGTMSEIFEWIVNNGGMETVEDYPYIGKKQACHQDPSKYVLKLSGYEIISTQDEDEIKEYLYEKGPLAIGINGDLLMYYKGGILDDPAKTINHAVVLVGYGEENGIKYWIIRNSWGSSWGEKGYARIARGKGALSINKYVTTGLLK